MSKFEKKFIIPFLIFAALAIGLIIGRFSYIYSDQLPKIYRKSRSQKLLKLIDLINKQYVDNVNTDSIVDNVISDILFELDPHSTYYNSNDYSDFEQEITGKYYGIGIKFSMVFEDTPVVVRVFPNSPAQKAHLLVGDMITRIDSLRADTLSQDSIVLLIKSSSPTPIKLGIYRTYNDSNFTVTIKRAQIRIPTVIGFYVDSLDLGYVKILNFGRTTYQEFMRYIDSFPMDRIRGLILDLQDNRGGLLYQALNVLDEFLPKDMLLCYMKSKNSVTKKCYSLREGKLEKLPLAVLVNKNTASASELIAGALQDYDRATIIGTRTFGKGLVQSVFRFSDGSVISLTTSRYYTPSGRCLQKPYKDYIYDYVQDDRDTSILDTTKKFKTRSGRTVYGGGGVFPDIVLQDTVFQSTVFVALLHVKLLKLYGPLLVNYSVSQIEHFVDSTLSHAYTNYYKALDYQLIESVHGELAAQKFYFRYSPMVAKAVEVLTSKNKKHSNE